MNYTFENRDTGKQVDRSMSVAEMETFITENPQWFVVIKPLGRRDNFIAGTGLKTDEGFRDILREIKKVNPGNTIDVL